MKRIIFTGGVHAGKTTILKELEKLGFTVAPKTGMMKKEIMRKYYKIVGCKIIDVLEMPVKDRIDFVLEKLKENNF